MAEPGVGWGCLEDSEGYGRLGDDKNDYKLISMDTAMSDVYANYKSAAHGMIFARKSHKLWDLYDQRGLVMMQLRFDGVFGFPGGLVDTGESVVTGLNREMYEEISLDLTKYSFTDKHHLAAYLHEEKKFVLHFYLMEVSEDDFIAMEKKVLSAAEYGVETYGTIRVPLFTMGDGIRGLPAFLANHFAGNARSELVLGLLKANLFTEEEITAVLKASDEFKKKS